MNSVLSAKVFIQSIKIMSSKTWMTEWKPEKSDLFLPCKQASFVWLGKSLNPGDGSGYKKRNNLVPPVI